MNLLLKPLCMASALICGGALLSTSALAQATATVTTQTSATSQAAAKATSTTAVKPAAQKPSKKKTRRKAGKPYSKATLSAFAPYAAPAAAAPLATSNVLGVPATVSTVVAAPQGEGLRESLPTPLAEADTSSALGLQMQPQGLLASDPTEAKPITAEEALAADESAVASTTSGGETALGQEELSVIDRTRDKPKAQPIASGPLRVRVKDSGVRASVQIPLEVLNNN